MEEKLAMLLCSSHRAVFFGGAGVSSESGIPDFRSTDGLYRQAWQYPPETILSRPFFDENPEAFFRFYREKMLYPMARPNAAHRALCELEKRGLLSCVITQNIDGLHQAAGSKRVIELHGSVHRNFCMRCKKAYKLEEIMHGTGIPRCSCGGVIKPDVVLYGEALSDDIIERALFAIEQADLLIIGGTSLTVYPAASFVADFHGPIAVLNRSETGMEGRAAVRIHAPIGETFATVMRLMEK